MIPVLALVGSTASGKSALALEVARRRGDIEVVSVDSMQVYRGMDIGTAKPTAAEQSEVPHHVIDVADPADDYTVSRYQHDAGRAVADIVDRGRIPLLVGGTGLYLRAVLDDLDIPGRYPEVRAELDADGDTAGLHERLRAVDPVAAGRTEPTNRRRIVRALEVTVGSGRPFSSYGPGLDAYPDHGHRVMALGLPRPVIDRRIHHRYDRQMAAGLLDEVETLARRPAGLSATARQALGYRELLAHVEQAEPLDTCLDVARTRTRRFARRQERWFRRDPRIRWIAVDDNPLAALDPVLRQCEAFVEEKGRA